MSVLSYYKLVYRVVGHRVSTTVYFNSVHETRTNKIHYSNNDKISILMESLITESLTVKRLLL